MFAYGGCCYVLYATSELLNLRIGFPILFIQHPKNVVRERANTLEALTNLTVTQRTHRIHMCFAVGITHIIGARRGICFFAPWLRNRDGAYGERFFDALEINTRHKRSTSENVHLTKEFKCIDLCFHAGSARSGA